MLRLNHLDRDIMERLLAGKSMRVVAGELNMPEGTLRQRLTRARTINKLRSTIQLAVAFSKEYERV